MIHQISFFGADFWKIKKRETHLKAVFPAILPLENTCLFG
eukprot:COSAG01_NODE_77342_length_166_cov_23.253731_1_plen_39_part_10